MCVHHVPSPAANAKAKIEHIYTGPSGTELAEVMADCDPEVIKKLMSLIDFKLHSIDLILNIFAMLTLVCSPASLSHHSLIFACVQSY